MFQLIVSGTYFNVNDQNISPLSFSPSLPLSLSHSLPIFLSPSPTLLTSLSPSIPLSLSPSLLLSLSFSPTLPLYFSTSLPSPSLEPPVATEPSTTKLVVIIMSVTWVTRVTRVTSYYSFCFSYWVAGHLKVVTQRARDHSLIMDIQYES